MGRRKTQTKRARKSNLIHGMKEADVLQAFETLAKTLSISVRFEKGDFKSAICRVLEDNVILIQKDADPLKKIQIFAKVFEKINLDDIFVMPELKKIINENKED
jgi:hypothetical protein